LLQVAVLEEAQLAVEAYHSCCCSTLGDQVIRRVLVKSPLHPTICSHRSHSLFFYRRSDQLCGSLLLTPLSNGTFTEQTSLIVAVRRR
jgi:hypothetical protein